MSNLNLLCPINQLGYGIAGLNLYRELQKLARISLFPIGQMEFPEPCRDVINLGLVNAGFYDDRDPSVRIYHQNQLAEQVGHKRYGFPFFELNKLNRAEVHHMAMMDGIMVTSEWGKQICLEHKIIGEDISIVPLGVDREIFNENIPIDRLDPDTTVFVNVGKWEIRKGHDVLLRAFNKAFTSTDKVFLKMVPCNPFIGNGNYAWENNYMGSPMGMAGKIRIFRERLPSQVEVARIMRGCDCGVFPAKAEAWNLDLLEALSCGLECIATNYSGHTAYINKVNCHLLETDGLETAIDNVWFHGDGEWAKINEDELISALRLVHRRKQTGQLELNQAGIATAKAFSWANAAAKLMEAVR